MLVWKITILRWKITILRWKITILVWTITILQWKITILVWKITILRWQITILVWKQHEATILKKHPKFNHTCSWNDHSKKHHTCIYICWLGDPPLFAEAATAVAVGVQLLYSPLAPKASLGPLREFWYQRGEGYVSTGKRNNINKAWISIMDIYGYLWISTANYLRFAMFKAIWV